MLLRVRLCCNDVIRMCLTVLCRDTCAPQITTKNRLSFCSRELGYEGCEDMQLWSRMVCEGDWCLCRQDDEGNRNRGEDESLPGVHVVCEPEAERC